MGRHDADDHLEDGEFICDYCGGITDDDTYVGLCLECSEREAEKWEDRYRDDDYDGEDE